MRRNRVRSSRSPLTTPPIASSLGTPNTNVYASEVEGGFHYGRATVTIPPTHTPGHLELPALWKLQRETDPSKHFVLKSVMPLNTDVARKEMTEKLQGMGTK